MRPNFFVFLSFPLFLTACPVISDSLTAADVVPDNAITIESIRIIDGDTAEILIAGQESQRVRFLGIDAPEKKQAFGKVSTKTLQECTSNRPLQLVAEKTDRYGRLVGKIYAGGIDCNLNQIKKGMAWHYKAYQKEQTPADRERYAHAETQAQQNKIGLWVEKCVIAPWDYRKKMENCAIY